MKQRKKRDLTVAGLSLVGVALGVAIVWYFKISGYWAAAGALLGYVPLFFWADDED